MLKRCAALAAAVLLAACSSSTAAPAHSPSPHTGGLPQGLLAFVSDQGAGVIDPSTGKATLVTPWKAGTYRVAGPVWAPAPDLDHPVIYFTLHDVRPTETRNSPGVLPYDWLFRADPFLGTVEPVAASLDQQSEGPIGLVGNSHYLALTVGCCASYEVDAFDLTQAAGPLKALARPPAQPAFFTEGVAPGVSGLIAVRGVGTGAWYWLNADAGVLNPFPLKLGPDDGPIAISPDGTLAAVALPDHGAVVQPINSSVPLASPSESASPSSSASPQPTPSITAPKRVNSRMMHPDGLAWSPDSSALAVAYSGEIQLYPAAAPDGAQPTKRLLIGSTVSGIAWSGPISDKTYGDVKASAGPQAMVDGLLAATKLPAQADTPANRPLTKVYVWQFDSSKPSPIETITDATADVLARYAPLNAGVVFHHWAALDTWALLGGCYRYRVVITGSVAPTAVTVGLGDSTLCSARPSSSPTPSASHS